MEKIEFKSSTTKNHTQQLTSDLFKTLSSSGVEQKIKPISELDMRERERGKKKRKMVIYIL